MKSILFCIALYGWTAPLFIRQKYFFIHLILNISHKTARLTIRANEQSKRRENQHSFNPNKMFNEVLSGHSKNHQSIYVGFFSHLTLDDVVVRNVKTDVQMVSSKSFNPSFILLPWLHDNNILK